MRRPLVSHETSVATCIWCWGEITAASPHTVLRASSGPACEVHLHPHCIAEYYATSPAMASHFEDETSPQDAEISRMEMGLTLIEFSEGLKIDHRDYSIWLQGGKRPSNIDKRLHALRNLKRARHGTIDWSNPTCIFSLCLSVADSVKASCQIIGVTPTTIHKWVKIGVPTTQARQWRRLNLLAERRNLDEATLSSPEHIWTIEHLQAEVEQSGKLKKSWALACELPYSYFGLLLNGHLRLTRYAAWHLSRGAVRLGAALPPEGIMAGKNRDYTRTPKQGTHNEKLVARNKSRSARREASDRRKDLGKG